MDRRTLLTGCGAICAGVLAGCNSSGENTGETPTPTDGDTPTATATQTRTATETPTETETPTATETQTPTPKPESFTHELDEEFTVGEGDNRLTYRILELTRADEIGNEVNFIRAEGTFLIVTLEVTNPQEDVTEFPWLDVRLRTDDAWQRFDRQPSEKIEADERIEVDYIGDATFPGRESKIGGIVSDVDPEGTYRIWITPAGESDTPEHFVPVGDISSLEELGGYY